MHKNLIREERKAEYNKAPDFETIQKRHEEAQVELRRKKRSDHIAKRRAWLFNNRTMAQDASEETDIALEFEISQISGPLLSPELGLLNPNINPTERLLLLISFIRDWENLDLLQAGVQVLRKILSSEKGAPLEVILETGITKKLIQCMMVNNGSSLKNDAAWCITNLASGNGKIVNQLINEGAIEALTCILSTEKINPETVTMAVWALGNIAGENLESCDKVTQSGAGLLIMNIMLNWLNISNDDLSMMVWALSNLFRGQSAPSIKLVQDFLLISPQLLEKDSEKVLIATLWCFAFIAESQRIQMIMDTGIIQKIVNLCGSDKLEIRHPAVRTIGNLAANSETLTQSIINYGVLDKLETLINCRERFLKKIVLWSICNICGGTPLQAEAVARHDFMKSVISLLDDEDFEIRKEAIYILCNLTSNASCILILKNDEQSIIEKIISSLSCKDPQILMLTLNTLENLLSASKEYPANDKADNSLMSEFIDMEGLDKLENLQRHLNVHVYNKVSQILKNFFSEGEELKENQQQIINYNFW
ncbi:unnamed protein product [Blepharisma stoltei]|uniref:Importin subunit alpha n=1 Tax=Blepharisma stoltei TaxID=1481888 RepID=A0AAU9JU22_9CILI|nr:unnamed protein product [Blepharisma stoltei]